MQLATLRPAVQTCPQQRRQATTDSSPSPPAAPAAPAKDKPVLQQKPNFSSPTTHVFAAAEAEADSNKQPPPPAKGKAEDSRDPHSRSSTLSWKSVTLTLLAGCALLTYYNIERARKQTEIKQVVSIGRAAIGGPFELTSSDGKTVSSESLQGQYLMLYFGFTHCPDICPAEMIKMNDALDKFDVQIRQHRNARGVPDSQLSVKPVFISIDPARDTPVRLAQYAATESPTRSAPRSKDMLWLTGPDEVVRRVARLYRVYYSAPDVKPGEDYLVDHSIFFYLVDKRGDVLEYFGKSLTSQEVADKMTKLIGQDLQQSGSA